MFDWAMYFVEYAPFMQPLPHGDGRALPGTNVSYKRAALAWRILKRAGVSRLPSNMRYRRRQERFQRYEKPLPGHQLQVDVKFLAPIASRPRRYYQYTAIDDCTRVRVLKIYERNTQRSAIAFIDEVLAKLPFGVECIQTDNGNEFGPQFH